MDPRGECVTVCLQWALPVHSRQKRCTTSSSSLPTPYRCGFEFEEEEEAPARVRVVVALSDDEPRPRENWEHAVVVVVFPPPLLCITLFLAGVVAELPPFRVATPLWRRCDARAAAATFAIAILSLIDASKLLLPYPRPR
jgi:hypothetical protein